MKKPERLVGFVSYEEKLFPFEFDEKEFKVNLYPPTREIWEQYSSVALTLERLQQTLETSNEWISYGELSGKTSEGYQITFYVPNDYSAYHGFLSFSVAWYFIREEKYSSEEINGFRMRGPEIDAFFPPESVFKLLQYFQVMSDTCKFCLPCLKWVAFYFSVLVSDGTEKSDETVASILYGLDSLEKP